MWEKEEKKAASSPSLAFSYATNNYEVYKKSNYLRTGIWIEGPMGYPSGDVKLTFTSVGVVLSSTCMASVFEHNEGLHLDEITQREWV